VQSGFPVAKVPSPIAEKHSTVIFQFARVRRYASPFLSFFTSSGGKYL
jgi:hypothetical protein